ncbi:MAG: cytochrome C [Gammaproteobacteria bacterium]|nr:cytochrome C [Gammaproteobacteria bacterium]
MQFVKLALWRCLVVMLVGLFQSVSAETIDQRTMLSITCSGCHSDENVGAIPSIAGKPAQYIEKALIDFRDDKRSSTVMGRHAKGYSDAEIKLIAEYFSAK